MSEAFRLPQFESEDEEARWWFENQDKIAEQFDRAAADGTLSRGRWKERLNQPPSALVSVQIDETDAMLAREAAARCGETFEAYVKRVVHEAVQLAKTA